MPVVNRTRKAGDPLTGLPLPCCRSYARSTPTGGYEHRDRIGRNVNADVLPVFHRESYTGATDETRPATEPRYGQLGQRFSGSLSPCPRVAGCRCPASVSKCGSESWIDGPGTVAEKRKRPRDVNQLGKAIKDEATREQPQPIRLVYRRQQHSRTWPTAPAPVHIAGKADRLIAD
jgi:hypothetical protein